MLIIYLIIGAFSGTLAGLLGIGGGIIVVPALSTIFLHFNLMPPEYVMHMAIGTSLASIIVTLLASLRAHAKRGSVRWDILWKLSFGIIVGTILGALVAQYLSGQFLRIFFSLFLFFISYRLIRGESQDADLPELLPERWIMIAVATIIGALSSILGAGGGTMLVPFFLRCRIGIREATGTSVACGVLIGVCATICFMLLGLKAITIPWSTGFIYWPAFLGISTASVLFAPIGTTISYHLPSSVLKRLLAIFLVLVATNMLIP